MLKLFCMKPMCFGQMEFDELITKALSIYAIEPREVLELKGRCNRCNTEWVVKDLLVIKKDES